MEINCYTFRIKYPASRPEKPDPESLSGRQRVTIRLANSVPITATVLAIVGAVVAAPSLVVERAVQTLRDGVLRENIGIKEDLHRDNQHQRGY